MKSRGITDIINSIILINAKGHADGFIGMPLLINYVFAVSNETKEITTEVIDNG